jgi:hypothetical protein
MRFAVGCNWWARSRKSTPGISPIRCDAITSAISADSSANRCSAASAFSGDSSVRMVNSREKRLARSPARACSTGPRSLTRNRIGCGIPSPVVYERGQRPGVELLRLNAM